MDYQVIIVGGGLAGLLNGIQLARQGLKVALFEKKKYPFHRVCGEYISNEVIPFLRSLDAYPEELEPTQLTRFQLTSVSGRELHMPLDLGGFGISRYALDEFLCRKARASGVEVFEGVQITEVAFENNAFRVVAHGGKEFHAALVIGAHGKRSKLDKALSRSFMDRRSDYIGVKYHIRTDFPDDTIALHNFAGGYCGISKVEGDRYNLCYLGSRRHLRQYGNVAEMEAEVVHRNPYLRRLFQESEFLFERPEVINEVSFTPKAPVEGHVLMSGDSAGLITPLCGNGMALAIHSTKLLCEAIQAHYQPEGPWDRQALENEYAKRWKRHFATRLWAGRKIQRLFGGEWASNLAVAMGKKTPGVARYLMSKTHGKPF